MTYTAVNSTKVLAKSAVPYTVVRTENGFDKAGALRYTNVYVDASRTDGSQVREVKTSIEQRRTLDLANGDEVLINELIQKKSTYPKKHSGVPAQRDPANSCRLANDTSGGVISGMETIGRYRTVRHVRASGQQTQTEWYALDADCALVQLRLEYEDGVTVQSLTSLVTGEPDSTLFAIPAHLQEAQPSSLYPPVCSDSGKCTSMQDSVKRRLDANYWRQRAEKQ